MAGRKKGQKNLKKVGKKFENQYGVMFTEKEKKKLESLVNTVNRKRKSIMTDERKKDIRSALGVHPDFEMGVHPEKNLWATGADTLLTRQRSKSLQRFKTKDEYRMYIKELKNLSSKDYVAKRMKLHKRNKIKALKSVVGNNDVVKGLNKLSEKEWGEIIAKDLLPEIHFINSDAEKMGDFLEQLDTHYEKIKSMYNKT